MKGRAWRRRVALALGMLALALLAALLIPFLALRSARARQWGLARVSRTVEERTGIRITARDFRLDLLAGDVVVEEFVASVPGARPFLTVRRLHVAVEPASLRARRLRIKVLELEEPGFDAAEPLPALPTRKPESAAAPPPAIDILRFTVRGGTVANGPVPEAAAGTLAGWTVHDLTVDGAFVSDTAELVSSRAVVEVRRVSGEEHELAVAAHGRATPGGPFELGSATVTTAGLRLAATASGSLAPPLRATLGLDVDVEPDRFVEELGFGGRLQLQASFALPSRAGTARVTVEDARAEAFRGLVEPSLWSALGIGATRATVTAESAFTLPDIGTPSVDGTATVAWTGHLGTVVADERLAEAAVVFRVENGARAEIRSTFLPDLEGRRSISGTVVVPRLERPADAVLEAVQLDLDVPDLRRGWDAIRQRWPYVAAELPRNLPPPGGLKVRANIDGPALDPSATIEAVWEPEAGSRVSVQADGHPATLTGSVTADLDDLRLAALAADLAGRVSGSLTARGTPAEYTAQAHLTGRDIAIDPTIPTVDDFVIDLSTDGIRLEVARLDARIGDRTLAARGHAELELPLRYATVHLEGTAPANGIETAIVDVVLSDGVLFVDAPELRTPAGFAACSAEVPLRALEAIPDLASRLASLPVVMRDGWVHVRAFAPELDSCRLAEVIPALDRPERIRAGLNADLWIDTRHPAFSRATLEVASLSVVTPDTTIRALHPLSLQLSDGKLSLGHTVLEAAGTTLAVTGGGELEPGWTLRDTPAELLRHFSAEAAATIAGATMTPYLAGGSATGDLAIEATVTGAPKAFQILLEVRGDTANFFWPTPYATKIESPSILATTSAGGESLLSGSARINGGSLEFTGSRTSNGRVEATIDLHDIRYLLDFGIRTVLAGSVDIELDAAGAGDVGGLVIVQRGVLDRPIDLERELLPRLLAPVTTMGTETNALDRLALDLRVDTQDGIRVKNNLADLRLRWDRFRIQGTAWNPLFVGTVDIDPGGLVFAYGQTLRIDRGTITFTGDPLTDPHLELVTTSSLQDPSISAGSRLATAAPGAESGSKDLEGLVASGVAGYFGERLASGLGQALGLEQLVIKPLLVFGETDPSARLTLSQSLSRSVAFAVTVDLRQAQRQTYLMEVDQLRALPTLTAQVFTNDRGNEGATLQQTLELGGTRNPRPDASELRKLVIDAPKSISSRVLRRATGLHKGDLLPEGAAVDIELELLQRLRQLGWPEARVKVEAVTVEGQPQRIDLRITVDPGVEVEFSFRGEAPPTGSRSLITSLYRGDIWEKQALEDMRRAAVRVFRSLGYLDPDVVMTVSPESPTSPRIIIIHTEPGRHVQLDTLAFDGVPPDAANLLGARFAGPVERVELARGLPEADRRVVQALEVLGYPAGRVESRRLSEDGRHLAVAIDPGERRHISSVDITGLSEDDTRLMRITIALAAGDPLRRDYVALAALSIEENLRSRGHADASVRPVIEPSAEDGGTAVRFEVRPGPSYRIDSVDFPGRRSTARSFALRLSGLESGDALVMDQVRAGQRALLSTGLYTAATPRVDRRPDGGADVGFELVERSRFSIAYGLRWESSVGSSVVVDAVDRNFAGRGFTLGARAQYEPDDRSARLYFSSPHLLGTDNTLEIYVLRRRQIIPTFFTDVIDDTTESAVQLSRALGRATTARIYGRYHSEHLFEKDPDFFFPLDTRITHPYFGAQLVVDTRDDPVLARRGLFASIDLSGSGTALGSDFSYLRAFGQINIYRPIGTLLGRQTSWAQSVRVGAARASGQELLRDTRFFAGGEYSVRGYETESLGPIETLGDLSRPLGGELLFIVNEELRLALPLDLLGIVFLDAGQVWATSSEVALDLATSAGIGVRAMTPIGVLRLDLATPFDRKPGDAAFKLYLGFGSVF